MALIAAAAVLPALYGVYWWTTAKSTAPAVSPASVAKPTVKKWPVVDVTKPVSTYLQNHELKTLSLCYNAMLDELIKRVESRRIPGVGVSEVKPPEIPPRPQRKPAGKSIPFQGEVLPFQGELLHFNVMTLRRSQPTKIIIKEPDIISQMKGVLDKRRVALKED